MYWHNPALRFDNIGQDTAGCIQKMFFFYSNTKIIARIIKQNKRNVWDVFISGISCQCACMSIWDIGCCQMQKRTKESRLWLWGGGPRRERANRTCSRSLTCVYASTGVPIWRPLPHHLKLRATTGSVGLGSSQYTWSWEISYLWRQNVTSLLSAGRFEHRSANRLAIIG